MTLPGRAGDEGRRGPAEAEAAGAPAATGSPCINVCRMDAAGRFCEGCGRTLTEIAAWSSMNDAARCEVWRQLAQRRVTAAAGTRPPPGESP
jgi:predicted Fe-S protein YdhL (DUF1289 family)